MVHFVGAGPGAPDLITVRGQRLIREADVIIYAGSLVNPALLDEAKQGCQVYNSAMMTLGEILAVMQQADQEGLMCVRLHTGDPAIYGAIREQMDELKKLGIDYDVCPGVSALFGAAASLKMEYTLPDVSQTVIITRTEGRTAVPEKERLRELASHQSTIVLFLSSGLADKVKEELLTGGCPPDTPAAVVYKATWDDEKILYTTIGGLPDAMRREQINKTALLIIGRVLDTSYARSRLYDASFTTEYRKGKEL